MKISLLLCFFLLTGFVKAQPFYFSYFPDVKLSQNGQNFNNAWAGGFNSAQFSTIKLNDDDIEDLVIFDRTSRKILTFLAVRQGNSYFWQHNPKYESQFPPDINNWILLVDYDRDGKKDIFTDTNGGFRVFRNTSSPIIFRFEQIKNLVFTQGFSGNINLAVPVTDIPAFTDLDDDGDTDVLTYDVQGTFVEYHKNLSRERFSHSDSLVFQKVGICWGKFQEGGNCQEFSFGVDCPPANEGKFSAPAKILHSGSTLLILDLNGDGKKDALLGDVSCDFMFKMINEGTSKNTVFTKADYFPNPQTRFPTFPASFSEDIDFDGKKDLLISPNPNTNQGRLLNFRQSAWLYKNNGTIQTPDFQYVQQDFLQNTMIDLGENATPAFADLDADGDLDMLVGNAGNRENGIYRGVFTLYENTGTKEKPSFELKDADYQLLSSQNFTEIKPFFADIDRNGTLDLGFTASVNNGQTTQLRYLQNLVAVGQPFQFNPSAIKTLPLPLLGADTPYLYDLDNDGDLDALIGKINGSLQFYRNTGGSATAPVYTLENEAFLGIADNNGKNFPAVTVADFDKNNQPDLLYANNSGRLEIFANFLQNLSGTPASQTNLLLDSLNAKFAETRLGGRIFPATADLNNDGFSEIAVGSQGGGIFLLLNNKTGNLPNPNLTETAELYPNPTDGKFYLNLKENSNIAVFSVLGQKITELTATAQLGFEINGATWANGMYLVSIKSVSDISVKRVIVNR